ncbi:MAG TPA: PSP1 domain-containing protein [Mucilaginibacter sp.]|nr:PSP1 domain-containing protein [Mucilaginibacter sp.]
MDNINREFMPRGGAVLPASGYFGQSDAYDWVSVTNIPDDNQQTNIVEIQFKGHRKEFYINRKNLPLRNQELVVVSGAHRGYDIGQVSLTGPIVLLQLKKKKIAASDVVKMLYRIATAEDLQQCKTVKAAEKNALLVARVTASEIGLSMKFCDADFQADGQMVTFYYTAKSRVDFRELIKILNKRLQVYIKMHQIGLLEESRRLGSIGPCGKAWCCHTWSARLSEEEIRPIIYTAGGANRLRKSTEGKFECYIRD